jgi:glycosyltransferase involved in cell wall biosynthesis
MTENGPAMVIAVEGGRLSSENFTGINNFVAQALLAWAKKWPSSRFIVVSHTPFNPDFTRMVALLDNVVLEVNHRFSRVPRSVRNALWFYTALPITVNKIRPNVFWSGTTLIPFFLSKGIRTVSTIHDLVPILYPKTMKIFGRLVSKISFAYSIRRADVLWVNSKYTKGIVQKYFPDVRAKPIGIAGAIDRQKYYPKFYSEAKKKEILARMFPALSSSKTLLFVGTLEPRKNLSFLITLMPALSMAGVALIVVGGSGWGKALSPKCHAIVSDPANMIFFSGRISDNDLAELYRSVDMFVSASHDEGLCMPAIEAMACGTPVALANNSAMSEIVGTGGVLIDGYQVEKWIVKLLTELNVVARRTPVSQAAIYNWDSRIQSIIEKI